MQTAEWKRAFPGTHLGGGVSALPIFSSPHNPMQRAASGAVGDRVCRTYEIYQTGTYARRAQAAGQPRVGSAIPQAIHRLQDARL